MLYYGFAQLGACMAACHTCNSVATIEERPMEYYTVNSVSIPLYDVIKSEDFGSQEDATLLYANTASPATIQVPVRPQPYYIAKILLQFQTLSFCIIPVIFGPTKRLRTII